MKTATTALLAALALGLAAPAFAEDGGSSLRAFNKERAKARDAGGYGNPFVAVPTAVADAVTDAMTGAMTVVTGEDDAARRAGRGGAAATTQQ